jgi:RluA family pseudouridine synthase
VNAGIKLSSPATQEFWEIPVLFEDEHLLALDKPVGLLTSPDPHDAEQPSLMKLLHDGIAAGKPWAQERHLTYLSNAHRLDPEIGGVLLLAKNKPALVALANRFGTGRPGRKYLALVRGEPPENQFEVDAPLAPHPVKAGVMHVDSSKGKKSKTRFAVLEKFPRSGYTLLRCEPLTERLHQIRVHLSHAGFKVTGDQLYGGKALWLSRLKSNYRLKPGREERPLISHPALHAEELQLPHPVTQEILTIKSDWPKDLKVAVKYLRQFVA